jgi:hypothetical protein
MYQGSMYKQSVLLCFLSARIIFLVVDTVPIEKAPWWKIIPVHIEEVEATATADPGG